MTLHAVILRHTASCTVELHGPHHTATYTQALAWIRTTLADTTAPTALVHVWYCNRTGATKPVLTRSGTPRRLLELLDHNPPANRPENRPENTETNHNKSPTKAEIEPLDLFEKLLVNHCFDPAELLDFIQA